MNEHVIPETVTRATSFADRLWDIRYEAAHLVRLIDMLVDTPMHPAVDHYRTERLADVEAQMSVVRKALSDG